MYDKPKLSEISRAFMIPERLLVRNWETRDEPADPANNPDPLADLRTAVAGLTTTVEQRLAVADAAVVEMRGRLDKAETALRRPGLIADPKVATELEKRAFTSFLRRGREGLAADEIRVLRVSDDTAGGYLSPDQFIAELLRNIVLFSPVRAVARVMNTTSSAVLLPKRTAGMTSQWVGEISNRPSTTVTFGQNRYPVGEIAAYVDVSNANLEDSAFDIQSELSFDFSEEFGRAEGAAFVNGATQLTPTGFMVDPTISYIAGGDANVILADGLISLFHGIKTPYRANAVWGMNTNTLAAVRKLKTSTGQYLLSMAGLENAPVTTLLGRPVVEMPDMPDVAAGAYPIVFGDFSNGYRIFDRVQLSILRDPFSQATNGMTRFHGRRRVAGGIGKSEALVKLKIATS
jgi:HK97 family phage major capsid protein